MRLVLSHVEMVAFAGDRASELAASVQVGVLAVALEALRRELVGVPGWEWDFLIAISLQPPPLPSSSSSWWVHYWNSVAERAQPLDCFAALHSLRPNSGGLCPRGLDLLAVLGYNPDSCTPRILF